MKKLTIFLAVLLALASVGAFAQNDYGVDYPDYGNMGGGFGACYTCEGNQNTGSHCVAHLLDLHGSSMSYGVSECHPMYTPPGPYTPEIYYCLELGSYCLWNASNNESDNRSVEVQAEKIMSFLRLTGRVPDGDLNDFIAVTDYALRGQPYNVAAQKRLEAFRAEFNRIVAHGDPRRELKPGAIPVMPHKPTKSPTAAIAVR